MSETPLVSFLVPVRDGADTLERAVASMRAQRTAAPFELVVVDDGSRDATPALLAALAEADPRIRTLRTGPEGIVAALDTGLAHCRGAFVARMDADDLCHPERLEQQLALLQPRDDLAAVGCLVALRPEPDDALAPERQAGMRRYIDWVNALVEPDDIAAARFVESPVIHTSAMVRTHVLRDTLGGYRHAPAPEDYDLWLRLLGRGLRIAKVPRVLVEIGDRPRRLTRTDPRCSRDAFWRCKLHHLLHGPLADPTRPVLVWGAGRTGKRLLRDLADAGRPATRVADNNPRRHGSQIRGTPVVAPEALAHYRERHAPDSPVLVAVAAHGGPEDIEAWTRSRGWRAGRDHFFLAGTRLRMALAALVVLCATLAPASAEVRLLEREPFPLRAGVTLLFDTHQLAYGESRYWTRIDLTDAWRDEAEYEYAMFSDRHISRGTVRVLDLAACSHLDPWWGGDLPEVRTDGCDLWLSGEVFERVRAGESARFEIDTHYRKDSGVHLELVRRDEHEVELDGRTMRLPVLVVESSAGDTLWVYDDAANPFVLRSEVAGVYDWSVTRIWVEEAAPALIGPAPQSATP